MTTKKLFLFILSSLFLMFSCKSGTLKETPQTRFTSANPGGGDRNSPDYDNNVNNMAGNNENPPDGETEREISEADIVKVQGDTLYALSAYRGLLVVDISNPSNLQVLGRAPVYGIPFEMYVRDGVAWVIFSSFWTFTWDEETNIGSWNATSKLVTLDVSVPADIQTTGQYDLIGEISDSRMVGDILYLVAYENGYCWMCGSTPRTTVTSLYAGSPEAIAVVDQLQYESEEQYSWGRRSIYVNQNRMYIGGRNWNQTGSDVQVIDISDPSGVMHEGTVVSVAGSIDNRWQMDEYQGVFRVISQPGWSEDAPTVQTFTVEDADTIMPLGAIQLELPRPETLQSVRFDGERAYAVTFERVDPLFVIDLSDPANPVQRGELEIPGWLVHMEPRGDRLIALGVDWDATETLTMSLFDVSDMDAPTMIDRVNFGGGWSWMVEDQDRIHKALRIFDNLGLILMPYAGWAEYAYVSGIQIFSFTRDSLTRRGSAPHTGYARRAFLHRDRLFAMSDERVESFDITNVDAPVKLDTLKMARAVYNLVPFGQGYVAQIVQDWWAHSAHLEIHTIDDPDSMTPVGSLDLASLIFPHSHPWYYWWNIFNFYRTRIFANGNYLYLIWGENYWYWDYYTEDTEGGEPIPEEERTPTKLAVFDVSNPAAPELVSLTGIPHQMPWQRGPWSYWYTVESGDNVVQVGAAIVVKTDTYSRWWWWGYDGDQQEERPELYVIDVSVPEAPEVSFTQNYTENVGYGALLVKGDHVVTSFHAPVPGEPDGVVAFYMHRLDVSNPAQPVWTEPVNIPGSLVEFNPSTNRIISVDYQWRDVPAEDWQECYALSGYGWYNSETGRCIYIERSLNISHFQQGLAHLQRTHTFEGWIRNVRATGSRLFIEEEGNYYWWWWYGDTDVVDSDEERDDEDERPPRPDMRPKMHTIALSSASNYDIASTIRLPGPYSWLVGASGNHALVLSNTPPALTIYNAAHPDALQSRGETLLTGYSYDMQFVGNRIISANSMWGVQTITP